MALAPALRTAVRELDPAQPVSRVTTVEQTIREGISSRWFDAAVIGALSVLALTAQNDKQLRARKVPLEVPACHGRGERRHGPGKRG